MYIIYVHKRKGYIIEKTEEFKALASERYLDRIRDLDIEINVALANVAHAKSKLDIAGVSYGPHVAGSCSSSIPDKLSDLETALMSAQSDLIGYTEEMNRAKDSIKRVESCTYRAILKCRYLLNLDWSHTADAIGYSVSHAKSLRYPALVALYPFIPEEDKRNFPNAET